MVYHSGNQLVDPHLIFQKAKLLPKMHIADFGCGRTGHIVFPASKIVGERGTIYAVDIMKDVLAEITKRSQLENIHNIHTIWSDVEKIGKTSIPEKSLDVVLLINSLFHAEDASHMLAEANRLLKDKARIVVVDWINSNLPMGPNQEKLLDFGQVINWCQENGYVIQEDFEVGRYHRGIVFFKHD